MPIEITDPGLRAALEKGLGHPPPFSEEECRRLESPLHIEQARDISGLVHFPNLKQLEIFASDIQDLSVLAELTQLQQLRLSCLPVTDLSPLRESRLLEELDIVFTFAKDLHPLAKLPALQRGVWLGNPWSSESYYDLRPYLLRTPTANGQPPVIDFSGEKTWKFARKLHGDGLPLCFARLDTRSLLVKPGIPTFSKANCDFLQLPQAFVEMELRRPDFSVAGLFEKYLGSLDPAAPPRHLDDRNHYVIGNGQEAMAWVEASGLSTEAQTQLLRFIRRFSSLVFFREEPPVHKKLEADASVTLPAWLRQTRETLALVLPHDRVMIQFEAFDQGWFSDESPTQVWFSFGLIGPADRSVPGVQDGEKRLFAIGEGQVNGTTTLAINLADPQDQRVYAFDPEDMIREDALELGRSRPVFETYASLLGHIVALKTEAGEVIRAEVEKPLS